MFTVYLDIGLIFRQEGHLFFCMFFVVTIHPVMIRYILGDFGKFPLILFRQVVVIFFSPAALS